MFKVSRPTALRLLSGMKDIIDLVGCPVTEGGVTSWRVYLPENEAGWEDIRNGDRLDGGRYAEVYVDMEAIPVFRRLK